jgi:hypothetical protein
MKENKSQKEVQNELPKMNESTEEVLNFSELSSITGGKEKEKSTTGCTAIFSGHCSGSKEVEAEDVN